MDWKAIVSTVAPGIASALGGPLAGVAVRTIATLLLGKADASESEVQAAVLAASPADLLKLKEAEIQFRKDMKALDVDLARINMQDRGSARERESRVGGWATPTLASVIVLGFFVTVGYVLAGEVSLSGETAVLIGTLIGYVSAKADQVVSYYFGSSAGSEAKNHMLARKG